MNLETLPNGHIRLCGWKKCCPEIYPVDEEYVEIKDDFGATIRIRKEQANLIPTAVDKINESSMKILHD